MPIYNPPIITSTTSQYQLTASYLSASYSSGNAYLYIQSDGQYAVGTINMLPTVETDFGQNLYISAGSASSGGSSGDLRLLTQNCSAGTPGEIIIQTGGKTSTVSGTINLYSTNIQMGDIGSNNYVKVFRDSGNNRVEINALYSITASVDTYGILLDTPFVYKDCLDVPVLSTRTFTSNAAVFGDQTIYTTYASPDYVLEKNLIFLNSTISDATASNMRVQTLTNNGTANIPIGTIVQLYNSGSNNIYFKHNETSVTNTRLKLSGSVSRLLPTKTMIKFILDSDSNWYEV